MAHSGSSPSSSAVAVSSSTGSRWPRSRPCAAPPPESRERRWLRCGGRPRVRTTRGEKPRKLYVLPPTTAADIVASHSAWRSAVPHRHSPTPGVAPRRDPQARSTIGHARNVASPRRAVPWCRPDTGSCSCPRRHRACTPGVLTKLVRRGPKFLSECGAVSKVSPGPVLCSSREVGQCTPAGVPCHQQTTREVNSMRRHEPPEGDDGERDRCNRGCLAVTGRLLRLCERGTGRLAGAARSPLPCAF
jgi:hypothetical protein